MKIIAGDEFDFRADQFQSMVTRGHIVEITLLTGHELTIDCSSLTKAEELRVSIRSQLEAV